MFAGTPKIAGSEVKWEEDTEAYKKTKPFFPDDLPEDVVTKLQETAVQAYHALQLRDYGRIDIRPSCAQMLKDIGHPHTEGQPVYDVTFENVQAGERTSHLFRLANLHHALVLGTGTSGHDVAQDLYSAGAQVTLIQRGTTYVVSLKEAQRVYTMYTDGTPFEECDLLAARTSCGDNLICLVVDRAPDADRGRDEDGQQRDQRRRSRHDVLEIVQHQQQLLVTQIAGDGLRQGLLSARF